MIFDTRKKAEMDSSKQVYVLCADRMNVENVVVFLLTKEEAIEKSKMYPISRLQLFLRCIDPDAYTSSDEYYQNGVFFTKS